MVVGRYELVREVGRGGFGVVYEARDRELGRTVAFKAISPRARPEVAGEVLLREAEAAALCSHPNIVTLHDLGRNEQGPYLILEFLRGESLAARLARGPFAVPEALRVGVEVAKGLAHAHAHGVIHRDLKPGNVFVCDDGRVKVLDFGLAHAFGHRNQAGGTPGYMPPEQVEGAPEDERSDVWALGVMLFEMLSGRRPFADARPLERPAPRLEVTGVPGLGELVARMLATRPADRPRDGAEVLAAIELIEGDVTSAPATTAAQVRIRRRGLAPGWLLAGGLVAAAIAGAAGWGLRARAPSAPAAEAGLVTLAVLPLANLSGDATQEYLGDGMTEEITGKLSRLGGLAVKPRSSVAKYKSSPKDARDIGKELGVAYAVEGSVRIAGDRIRVSAALVRTEDASQVWSEILDARRDDVFEVQERVATRIVEALHIHLTPDEARSLGRWGTRNAEAYDAYLRGLALVERHNRSENMVAAQRHFGQALQADPDFASAMAGLAMVEGQMYRNFDAGPDRLARARVLLDRALAIDPKAPQALGASALLRANAYDYRAAAEEFRRATAVEPRSPYMWDGLCFVLAYVTPPEVVESERACRRALDLDPSSQEALYHLGRVLALQGRIAEAEDAIRRLEDLAPQSPYTSGGRFWIQLCAGRPRQALVALQAESNTQFVKGTALSQSWQSMALAQAGDLDGAFAALDDALAKGWRDVDQLRAGPFFEPLRRDPRYLPILAMYGLKP